MKVVIQRVIKAEVASRGENFSRIGKGLLIYAGIVPEDTCEDAEWLSKKIVNLRIFNDDENVMNRSLLDVSGEILVVSQFTLHALTKKGNRPSYIRAACPEKAIPVYEYFIKCLTSESGKNIKTGIFGAYMHVSSVNDGPVTIIIDSRNKE